MAATFDFRTMDGYYLRNALAMLKSETNVATMIVDPKYVTLSLDTKKTTSGKANKETIEVAVQYWMQFKAKENFPGFVYNSPLPYVSYSFMTKDMASVTKVVTKTDGVRFYHIESDDMLSIRALKRSNNPQSSGASLVKIVQGQDIIATRKFDFPEEADATMPVKEFSDRCKKANIQGCKYMILGVKGGVMSFKGVSPEGAVVFDEPYIIGDDYGEEDDEDIEQGSFTSGVGFPALESSHFTTSTPLVSAEDSNDLTILIPTPLCKVYANHITMCCNTNAIQKMYFDYRNKAVKIAFRISVIGKYHTVVSN